MQNQHSHQGTSRVYVPRGHVCLILCIVDVSVQPSKCPEHADHYIWRLMCVMLAAGVWQWAMLLIWTHHHPSAKSYVAFDGRTGALVWFFTACAQNEHAEHLQVLTRKPSLMTILRHFLLHAAQIPYTNPLLTSCSCPEVCWTCRAEAVAAVAGHTIKPFWQLHAFNKRPPSCCTCVGQ